MTTPANIKSTIQRMPRWAAFHGSKNVSLRFIARPPVTASRTPGGWPQQRKARQDRVVGPSLRNLHKQILQPQRIDAGAGEAGRFGPVAVRVAFDHQAEAAVVVAVPTE